MTNSPPANVKPTGGLAVGEAARVLVSGVDTVALAVNLTWPDETTFRRLEELKKAAKERGEGEPLVVEFGEDEPAAVFTVMPHGKKGYEWLLTGREMALRLGNWLEPKSRPSAMVEIRAETLWLLGPDAAAQRACEVLEGLGASVESIKPSRLDLCVDVVIRDADWHGGLSDYFITRARGNSTHRVNGDLSGFSIGKGCVSARIYDKAREIREKSHKDWMFGIWGLQAVPEGHRVIRVEFQLRRDALREVKLHEWDQVSGMLPRIWAYCSQRWLRLVQDASLHHTQQKELAWWSAVQGGFDGAQRAEPLVREMAISIDKKRLGAQSVGTLASIVALDKVNDDELGESELDPASFLQLGLKEAIAAAHLSPTEFTRRVKRKQAKYRRARRGPAQKQVTTGGRAVESASNPREAPG